MEECADLLLQCSRSSKGQCPTIVKALISVPSALAVQLVWIFQSFNLLFKKNLLGYPWERRKLPVDSREVYSFGLPLFSLAWTCAQALSLGVTTTCNYHVLVIKKSWFKQAMTMASVTYSFGSWLSQFSSGQYPLKCVRLQQQIVVNFKLSRKRTPKLGQKLLSTYRDCHVLYSFSKLAYSCHQQSKHSPSE